MYLITDNIDILIIGVLIRFAVSCKNIRMEKYIIFEQECKELKNSNLAKSKTKK